MITLLEHKIDSNICSNKILAMRSQYINREIEKCRACENYINNYECERFRGYQNDFSVRRGKFAIE